MGEHRFMPLLGQQLSATRVTLIKLTAPFGNLTVHLTLGSLTQPGLVNDDEARGAERGSGREAERDSSV